VGAVRSAAATAGRPRLKQAVAERREKGVLGSPVSHPERGDTPTQRFLLLGLPQRALYPVQDDGQQTVDLALAPADTRDVAAWISYPFPNPSMDYDVLIVGGGPAGLAAGIRLKQCAAERGTEISVCLIDKGAEIGAHILSGAIMDPRALSELIPEWREQGAPVTIPVTDEHFLFFSSHGARRVPNALLPACFRNDGNYIIRLGHVVKWLGEQAEQAGVDVYPGFCGADVLYDETGSVKGAVTGDMGVRRDGRPGGNYQPGMEIHARYTLFAEGCRGHLGRQLADRFNLHAESDPQIYAIGIKELWEVPAEQQYPGRVVHTAGWPMDNATYGGGFLYHQESGHVATGFIVGLNYTNPYLSPFDEFQRFKTHPAIRRYLERGKRIGYGARAITVGGLQSLPRLVFPGGALIGDNAGFLNPGRIKGVHTAIKSGILAAEAAADALAAGAAHDELTAFPKTFRGSWLYDELHRTRNFKPYLKYGLRLGGLLFATEQIVLRGRSPWTLRNRADHEQLKPAADCSRIDYPKPDGQITYDRSSSVFLSNTHHGEDQPCHLVLKDASVPVAINLAKFEAPERLYCPAGVYEIVVEGRDQKPRLQINAQNCVHCKTCDIKDPSQNIVWRPPQGGEGPVYRGM
jgi:electron-transferring-flavoprotein dehydrogenase